MNFEDFETEWKKALLDNPPYVSVGLENDSVIWANHYRTLDNSSIVFSILIPGEIGHSQLIDVARIEPKNIIRVYNPWSD